MHWPKIAKTEEEVSVAQVHATAIRLLARREHSSLELQQKLGARDFPAQLVVEVLQQLIAQGLLSDTRFAEVYCRARRMKGYGPIRIAAELHQRGVMAEIIEQCLYATMEAWAQQAHQVRIKKFGKKVPEDFVERARQMRFLQYRGFNNDDIQAAFT